MKTKLFLCTLLCMFMSISAFGQSKETATADMAKMVGDWTFSAPNPMGGDDMKGVCTFTEKDGKKIAVMKMDDSSNGVEPMETTALEPNDDGACYGNTEAQGYSLTVSFKLKEDGKIQAVIDAGVMQIPFEMTKK